MAVLLVKVCCPAVSLYDLPLILSQSPETRKYSLSRIRGVLCGAAPFPAELMERLAALLPNAVIGQGYGSSNLSIISPFKLIVVQG